MDSDLGFKTPESKINTRNWIRAPMLIRGDLSLRPRPSTSWVSDRAYVKYAAPRAKWEAVVDLAGPAFTMTQLLELMPDLFQDSGDV